MEKNIKSVISFVNRMTKMGLLEVEDKNQLINPMKSLTHALKTKNSKKAKKAIEEFCHKLTKIG